MRGAFTSKHKDFLLFTKTIRFAANKKSYDMTYSATTLQNRSWLPTVISDFFNWIIHTISSNIDDIIANTKRFLSGAEFASIYGKNRKMLINVATSYIHDKYIAEDIVNDSFIRLWEKRDVIKTGNFESYLFSIVIRKCLDHLRSEHTYAHIMQNMQNSRQRMLLYEIESLQSCNPTKVFEKDIEKILKDCIGKMPRLTREVFIASRSENLTYQEISEKLGISVRRVTSEIQTALSLLRNALKDYL